MSTDSAGLHALGTGRAGRYRRRSAATLGLVLDHRAYQPVRSVGVRPSRPSPAGSDRWRRARSGLIVLGLFYSVPFAVAAAVVQGTAGTVLLGGGLALGVLAAVRGGRVDLGLQGDQLLVTNRWRVVPIALTSGPRLVPVTPWWMLLARMATVHMHGVSRPGRLFDVPALATMGVPSHDPRLVRLIADLDALSQEVEGPPHA